VVTTTNPPGNLWIRKMRAFGEGAVIDQLARASDVPLPVRAGQCRDSQAVLYGHLSQDVGNALSHVSPLLKGRFGHVVLDFGNGRDGIDPPLTARLACWPVSRPWRFALAMRATSPPVLSVRWQVLWTSLKFSSLSSNPKAHGIMWSSSYASPAKTFRLQMSHTPPSRVNKRRRRAFDMVGRGGAAVMRIQHLGWRSR